MACVRAPKNTAEIRKGLLLPHSYLAIMVFGVLLLVLLTLFLMPAGESLQHCPVAPDGSAQGDACPGGHGLDGEEPHGAEG